MNQNEDYKIGYRQGLSEAALVVDTMTDLLNTKLTPQHIAQVKEWLLKTAKDLHKRGSE